MLFVIEMYFTQEFSKQEERSESDIFFCLRGNVFNYLAQFTETMREPNENWQLAPQVSKDDNDKNKNPEIQKHNLKNQ